MPSGSSWVFGSGLLSCEDEADLGAAAGAVSGEDGSAVGVDDLVDDGEAQAGARLGSGVCGPVEAVEDSSEVVGWDSDAALIWVVPSIRECWLAVTGSAAAPAMQALVDPSVATSWAAEAG
jgi:hypothetical protein